GNISVGYRIHKTEITEDNTNNTITVRVTDWEPMELSVLAVPADYTAGVRGADQNFIANNYFEIQNQRNMEEEEVTTAASQQQAATENQDATRSAAQPVQTSAPAPAAASAANGQEAVTAERKRV